MRSKNLLKEGILSLVFFFALGAIAQTPLINFNFNNNLTNNGSVGGTGYFEGGGTYSADAAGLSTLSGDYAFLTGANSGDHSSLDKNIIGSALNGLTQLTAAMWYKAPIGTRGAIFRAEGVFGVRINNTAGQFELFDCPSGKWSNNPTANITASADWQFIAFTLNAGVLKYFHGTKTAYQGVETLTMDAPITLGSTLNWNFRVGGLPWEALPNAFIDNFKLYNVALSDAAVMGLYNDALIVSTDTEAPTTPTGLSAASITSTGFTLNWSGASSDNESVAGYQAYNGTTLIGTSSGTGTSMVVTGLTPSTTYNVTLLAKDAAGNKSTQSTALDVTTSSILPVFTENFDSYSPGSLATSSTWTSTSGIGVTANSLVSSGYGATGNRLEITGSGSRLTLPNTYGTKPTWMSFKVRCTSTATAVPQYISFYKDGAEIWSVNKAGGDNKWRINYNSSSAATVNDPAKSVKIYLLMNPAASGDKIEGWIDAASEPTAGNGSRDIAGGQNTDGTPLTDPSFNSIAFNTWGAGYEVDDIRIGNFWTDVYSSSADTEAPSTPTGLSAASITTTGFTLNWTGASTDNFGILGYEAYNGTTLIGNSIGTGTSMVITGLTASTIYNVTLVAMDAAGNTSVASSSLAVTTSAPTLQPVFTENFDSYSPGSLATSSTWTSTSGIGVTANSLVSSGYGATGNRLAITGNGNRLTLANTYGTGVTWMSFKVRCTSTATAVPQYISFYKDGAEIWSVNKAGGDNKWRINYNWSSAATVNDPAKSVTIYLLMNPAASGDKIEGWIDAASEPTAGNGSRDIAGGQNTDGTPLTDPSFNSIAFNTWGAGYEVDDIRIGNVWSDVYIALTDTEAPTIPTGLSAASITSTGFTLNWTGASSDNVAVTGYEAYNGLTLIGTSTGTGTTMTITGLTASTIYNVTLIAIDAAGNKSVASSSLSVTTSAPTLQPVFTENFDSYSPGSLATSSTWTSTSGIGVTANSLVSSGYGATGNRLAITGNGSRLTLPNTYGTKPTWMSFKVRCTSTSTAVPQYISFYKDGAEIWSVNKAGGDNKWRINYNWSSAATVNDPAKSVTIYLLMNPAASGDKIEGWIDAASEPTAGNGSRDIAGGQNTDGTPLTDPSFNSIAFNTWGAGYEVDDIRIGNVWSDVYTALTDTEAPTIPTGLSAASITSTGFTLNWTGASSDNVAVTGYEAYNGLTLIGTSTGTGTTMTITGLTASTIYNVTLVAMDAAGNKSVPSSALAVTTSAPTLQPVFTEDFDSYSPGSLATSSTWTSTSGIGVTANSLVSSGYGATGNRLAITGNGSRLTFPNTYGTGVTWMSFKVRCTSTATAVPQYISFYKDGAEIWSVNKAGGDNKWRINYNWSSAATVNDPAKSVTIYLLMNPAASGDKIEGWIDAASEPTAGNGSRDIAGGQNTDGSTLTNPSFNSIAFNTWGAGYEVDDIRIGNVWADVYTALVPLPVNFISFNVKPSLAGNDLKWTVANEINNKRFEVLRSTDGLNFVKIGEVNSTAPNGNNAGETIYYFTDKEKPSAAYYKIKQVDLDGRFKYSGIVYLNGYLEASPSHIYPNPVTNNLNLVIFAEQKANISLEVFDQLGKGVFSKTSNTEKGKNNLIVNMSAMPVGVYLLKVKNNTGKTLLIQKVIKN